VPRLGGGRPGDVDRRRASHLIDDSDRIEALERVETDAFADRERVGYRCFLVRNPEGLFEVEQQVFIGERDGKIGWMRSVCSGFRPVDASSASP